MATVARAIVRFFSSVLGLERRGLASEVEEDEGRAGTMEG
jgi:hypothetical protein